MKRTAQLIVIATLTTFACTKQKSQQPDVNSTQTDARHDVSNQSGTVASPENTGKEPVTTNPNSARSGTDSTLNTSQGAAVVGDANINPRAEGEAGKTPTSVDNAGGTEPKSDATVQQANCKDTKPGTSCPPTAQSPMKDEETTKDIPKR
ncbi:MAG: hypothetical protein EOP10_00710 [Proteobacteria bacterium]|nr:MAG: hypothetical protein EOP10_00710 [Pseudomonadota bacterium]